MSKSNTQSCLWFAVVRVRFFSPRLFVCPISTGHHRPICGMCVFACANARIRDPYAKHSAHTNTYRIKINAFLPYIKRGDVPRVRCSRLQRVSSLGASVRLPNIVPCSTRYTCSITSSTPVNPCEPASCDTFTFSVLPALQNKHEFLISLSFSLSLF